jgi:proline iminopeptidase
VASLFVACSGSNSQDAGQDAGPPDSGADVGFYPDATPTDAFEQPDSGLPPNAFLAGVYHVPTTGLINHKTMPDTAGSTGTLSMYVLMLGTKTSTMPPLVIVPSGPGFSHDYLRPWVDVLLPGRTMVLYDPRGTGQTDLADSTSSSTVSSEQEVNDLKGVVNFLWSTIGSSHAPGKVDLFGHGFGAGIAAYYAAAHPEAVSRLVLTTPIPPTILGYDRYEGAVQARLTEPDIQQINYLENRPECRSGDLCRTEVWKIEGPHYMCPQNTAKFQELNFQLVSRRGEDYVERQLIMSSYDWTGMLKAVQAKTAVIGGACDPMMSASDYASLIPNAQSFNFSDSGHFPMVEVQDNYAVLLKQLLSY